MRPCGEMRAHLAILHAPAGQVSGSRFGYLVRLILQAGPDDWDLYFSTTAERVFLDEDDLGRFVGRYRLDGPAAPSYLNSTCSATISSAPQPFRWTHSWMGRG